MAKLRVSKKQILVGVGVVVLVAAAIGAGFLVRWLQTKDGAPAGQTTQQSLPDSVAKTEDLLVEGKTDEASKQIDESLKNQSISSEEKYMLYLQQGNIAVDKKDYNAAIQAYLSAESAENTYVVAGKIGSLYQLMGDNQKAIEYYKKAISLNTDQNNPTRERENEMYTEMIRNIGGQP